MAARRILPAQNIFRLCSRASQPTRLRLLIGFMPHGMPSCISTPARPPFPNQTLTTAPTSTRSTLPCPSQSKTDGMSYALLNPETDTRCLEPEHQYVHTGSSSRIHRQALFDRRGLGIGKLSKFASLHS